MLLPRVTLTILLLSLCCSLYAAGPHGIHFGAPYWGTSIVLNDQSAQAIADTGAGFTRLDFRLGDNSSDTSAWYSAYDTIVNSLRSRGVEIIGLMTNEAWSQGGPWSANAYETSGGDGWNPYLDGWCNAFLRYATHWKGKIKYWELWNEPDCLATIYPSNYGALLAHAYDLAHTNNLPVEIISGGLCTGESEPDRGAAYLDNTYKVSINNTGWFKRMKDKWGTYPLDHVGYHIYIDQWSALNTGKMSNLIDRVHNTYAAYEGANTTKKMFLTETAWETNNVSETLQAANLTSAIDTANSKPFVKSFIWFSLQDSPSAGLYFGVFRSGTLADSYKKQSWANLKTSCTYEGRWSEGGQINQPILDYFTAKGHAAVGNPSDDGKGAWVRDWDFGPVQDYDGGTYGKLTAFDSADAKAYCVRANYLPTVTLNHAALEFPRGDEFAYGSGAKQNFDGGYATWTQAGGVKLWLYTNKIVSDNSNADFSGSSSWLARTGSDAYLGNYRTRLSTATNSDPAVWTIPLPRAGTYNVYVRYPTIANATSSATYEVAHSTGTSTTTLNQQTRGARWNYIGSYSFSAGNAVVRLSSQGAAGQYVLADGVRLIQVYTSSDTTAPSTPIVTDDGQYTANTAQLSASWQSQDTESGIGYFEYAVGTTPTDPGGGYVVPWTNAGARSSVTLSLSLIQGTTYYFYVRACNTQGLKSLGASDGIKVDTTPPGPPIVLDDGDYTGEGATLHCSWSASDPDSGIVKYEYCIGSSPLAGDTLALTSAGTRAEVWEKYLGLQTGKTYYYSVRAYNGAGLASGYAVSDGIAYRPATHCGTIADVLAQPDSKVILLKGKLISAAFTDRFYVQDPTKPRGMAIYRASRLAEGSKVDVTGELRTVNGERELIPGCVTPSAP